MRLAATPTPSIYPLDSVKSRKMGSVFAVEIPAGNYRAQGWQISSGPTNVRSTAVTGIEFKVEAKTAIYLGNYDFKVTDTFMRNPSRATVTLREQRDRDLAAFKSAFPALAAVSVETTIADKIVLEAIGGPSVGRISLPIFIPTAR